MDISQLYEVFRCCRMVSTDTRNIQPGCLFFALKGEHYNGNDFALEALKKGALAAVMDEDPGTHHSGIIRVGHVLTTLQQLARYHRLRIGIPILAITGSNGKTTTKELCRAVLSAQYHVQATAGNLNNHIGVPLTLLSMNRSVGFGIVEMGANHPGEISLLCDIALPDYGIITNIGKAHLEGFGSLQGVTGAKGEMFMHLMHHRKTLFVNAGDPNIRKLPVDNYPLTVWYNGNQGLEVRHSESSPFLKLELTGPLGTLQTGLLGGYNAENVLAACCVGLHLGLSTNEIAAAVVAYRPVDNRSQLIETGRNRIYMDAYNANPSSMLAAISEFLLFREVKKVLILGEMRELGKDSREEHEQIIAYLRQRDIDNVICVGASFAQAAKRAGYRYAETTEILCEWLTASPITGHFVLIKGSRSNQLEKIIPLL
jgi:UDP-N-acetylmuramoyl-tripeptide--D-alanyl-D-alanine ligase